MASDALITQKPREQAGAQSYRAFDFQVHASMARILTAYAKGEQFAAYFDLFDDLIMVQEVDGQASISFYQVKARAGSAWTPKRLANRPIKGDIPKSIIGKSYHNIHEFGNLVRKAAIVSNQHLKAIYPDGSATAIDDGEILFSSLCEVDRKTLITALELDFPDGIDPRHAAVLTYERIPLDIQSFRQTLLGLVTEFVSKIGPEFSVAAKPLYDALLNEITRCTGTVANAKTLDQLKVQKGLGRADIDALVVRVQQRPATPMEWWVTAEAEFIADGWKTIRLRRLQLACLEYWRARERGAGPAIKMKNALQELFECHPGLLGDSIVESLAAYELACSEPEPIGDPYTRQAALLVEIMESLE
jgi:hypothetical protein